MNTVEYKSSVQTKAGWRSVWIKAEVEQISEKRAKVVKVISIDDEEISYNMSRTGANRQKYNGEYFASQEVGKIKNISCFLKHEVE